MSKELRKLKLRLRPSLPKNPRLPKLLPYPVVLLLSREHLENAFSPVPLPKEWQKKPVSL